MAWKRSYTSFSTDVGSVTPNNGIFTGPEGRSWTLNLEILHFIPLEVNIVGTGF